MSECSWWERASALVDGEVDPTERAVVESHVAGCGECARVYRTTPTLSWIHRGIDAGRLTVGERRWLGGDIARPLLVVAALALVAVALPSFIAGNGDGPHDHTQRHLAMWQLAMASGLCVAGFTSRFGYAILIVAASFLVLTVLATGYDLLAGHDGPWKDPVHLIELVAVVLLWRLTPPHLRPWRRSREPG